MLEELNNFIEEHSAAISICLIFMWLIISAYELSIGSNGIYLLVNGFFIGVETCIFINTMKKGVIEW